MTLSIRFRLTSFRDATRSDLERPLRASLSFLPVKISDTNASIADLAAKVRRTVAADGRVQTVYLFGSRVRGDASAASDVDLGILFRESVGIRDVVLLESKLAEALGVGVDLVDVGSCRTFLALEIIDGERIYCVDPLACDRFELYVLAKAGDLAHFERERRASLLQPAGIQR